ncbi:MAG: YkgJ family cysteine cluster protein [Desulfoarculaceae bacterium]|nr:YkgJ family cysteine cluster protein [Desulfoarculaceae bacterium]
MPPLKEDILQSIYETFAEWSTRFSFACEKNCASCCTQNVIMTAVEGEAICRLIRQTGRDLWFADKLQNKGTTGRPRMTTNDFAGACLGQGEDGQPELLGNMSPCPFLENDCCRIYEVRPFSCRCFASEQRCSAGISALAPTYYLSAATAVLQIIEHLGQGEYWGNMLDVLSALCDQPQNRGVATLLPASFADQSRVQLVQAKPLPGFLLLEDEMEQIAPLLEAIFSRKVGGKTVESILNGR